MTRSTTITVQFLGAAGTVTGSKFVLDYAGRKLMIDCGLFQGEKNLRVLNWQTLPFDASLIDNVLLTHGHLDHVGYLPLLVKQGFRGKIRGSRPTLDITRLILMDAARIQEEDAERANKYGYSKHDPARPLYTSQEAERVFALFHPEPIDEWIAIDPDTAFRLRYNGHILGSTFIELRICGKRFVFSGDLGRPEDPLLFPPEKPEQADVLFIESTYGNSIHGREPQQALAAAINDAVKRNGTIIIPGFAVERMQLIMYYLSRLIAEKQIPDIPVYMDSPMADHVMDVFARYPEWHKLTPADYESMQETIGLVSRQEQTNELAHNAAPKIIIAAAGMASGGRVLTYFEHLLDNPNTTVLFVGHQAEGTRGRALLDGEKAIKLRGKKIPVQATILRIDGLSAHADRRELTDWLRDLNAAPEKIFVVHGEKTGSEGLSALLHEAYGYETILPQLNERHTCAIVPAGKSVGT